MHKLIVFKAAWCGPCTKYAPEVDAAEETLAELGVEVERVDVDAKPDVAMKYGVRGIPFSVLETNDSIKDTWAGAKNTLDLTAHIKTKLGL